MTRRLNTHLPLAASRIAIALSALIIGSALPPAASAAPAVTISQIPLTIALPANPQVVFALTNSESMDGNLSGAIMTGSGSLGSNFNLFAANGISPFEFPIPAGFTPPLNGGSNGGLTAPYTVTSGGNLVDNSPSRLNVAKAGIAAVLTQFMSNADFALYDFSLSGVGKYTTWVYLMSPPGANFSFTALPGSGSTRTVTNPCYHYNPTGTDTASVNCKALDTFYSPLAPLIASMPYMVIGASSDDPQINDVLYAGGLSGACVVYGALTPANVYKAYTLSSYNAGGITDT